MSSAYDEDFDDQVYDDRTAGANDNRTAGANSPSRLSAGGEGQGSAYDEYEDEHDDYDGDLQAQYGDWEPSQRQTANGLAAHGGVYAPREESAESDYYASSPARRSLRSPQGPLAGSLEEQARLAVSQLIRDAVGDDYHPERVIFEEDGDYGPHAHGDGGDDDFEYDREKENESWRGLSSGYREALHLPHSDDDGDDGVPVENVSATAPPSRVKIAKWRMTSAAPMDGGHNTGSGGGGEGRRAAAAEGGRGAVAAAAASKSGKAEEPLVIEVGAVRVTDVTARLFGLDLNALSRRFSGGDGARAAGDGGGGKAWGGGVDRVLRPAYEKLLAPSHAKSAALAQAAGGFAKTGDARHCTFRPRGKSAARLAAARAAGFAGSGGGPGGNDDNEEDSGGGFRPSGAPSAREREVEAEKAFCRRQDAFVAQKRNDIARMAAELDYEVRLRREKEREREGHRFDSFASPALLLFS